MSREIRGLRKSEIEEHGELVFLSYAHGRALNPESGLDQMLARPDWWTRGAAGAPDYDPEQTRVLVEDGKLVCSVTCYPRPSYLAGRIARAVCIGSVCTHPAHRRRGLLRLALAEASEWMRGQGVLWSFLYGNQAVYGGSGWQHLTSWSLTVDLSVCEGCGAGLTARPATEEDLTALMAIYEQCSGRMTGPTVRSESYWRTRVLRRGAASGYSLVERGDEAAGYFAGEDGHVSELGWRGAASEVLAFLLRKYPGQEVSLPFCTQETLMALREISASPTQAEWHQHAGGVILKETSRGLWQYHGDPDGLFPEFQDTPGLLRFLREQEYVMWAVDQS